MKIINKHVLLFFNQQRLWACGILFPNLSDTCSLKARLRQPRDMKPQIKILFTSLFFLTAINTFGQTAKIKLQVDSLKYLNDDPFECNSLTWRIIASKKESIQILIDKLDDTTLTKASDKCKPTNLRVSDLAYLTLKRILHLPFFVVTGMQCDVFN